MKLNCIVFVLLSLFFGCETDPGHTRNWMEEINRTVLNYNKETQILETKTVVENGIKTDVFIFNINSDVVQKVVAESKHEYFINAKIELYTKNDEILLERMSGLSPLIYKGQKREIDPCCEVFDKKTYFKSSSEARTFMKKIKLMSSLEMETKMKELKELDFQEVEEQKNREENYNRTTKAIKEIKDKFK